MKNIKKFDYFFESKSIKKIFQDFEAEPYYFETASGILHIKKYGEEVFYKIDDLWEILRIDNKNTHKETYMLEGEKSSECVIITKKEYLKLRNGEEAKAVQA
jgi:hypothetical protein